MVCKEFTRFILRSPLTAFKDKTRLINDNDISKEKVKELFLDTVLSESLYIASPELYDEMLKWLSGKITDKKEEDKLIFSLVKYLSRMETRSTPFGLFAGCEVGIISEKTEVKLTQIKKYKRHTRLDMNFLCALSQDLSRNTEIKKKLQYFPNTSLYTSGNKYRYVEYHFEKSKRMHHIISIDKSTYTLDVLEKCKNGASYFEMVECVIGCDISLEDASAYIDELINNQIIVSELEPSTTGLEQLDYIISILDKILVVPELSTKLKNIATQINAIDNKGIGNPIERYEEIINIIKETATTFDKKYLFQTDLILQTEANTISKKIPEMVKEGISFLSKFNRRQNIGNLEKFKESFYERYEDREISLAEALDTELGIGYAGSDASGGDVTPLVDNLRISGKPGMMEYDMKWNIFQSFLLKKYREAIQKDLLEVTVADEEIDEITKDFPPPEKLADTFSAMIQVVEADTENDTYKIKIGSIGGSTGASLLGRFCHGDPKMLQLVNEIISMENELTSDAILAEIVHLPESRTGNVLLRPVIRNYEIPYLARASVNEEFQLKLEDLFLSVKNNQIVLRSKKLNKVIIPRLTNAHNFSYNALPVYQFLCDLQYQSVISGFGFSWGNLANEHPFLPRVVYKNLILSPSKWNIKITDVKKVFEEKDDEKLLENIRTWRIENKVPYHVLLSDGDNDLFIDLEVPLYLKMLWATVKSRQTFTLEEFLFNPEKPLVTSPEGWHTNEIILIFKNEKKSQ
ncbi:MAG: hypothetical protein A2X08_15500 [Bacteroidetes bacterium GWA2_32_17]|nr:MAG: hypothetical protein A2X08_15500 [Bacteroidetes bacterium GWA2_32_17]